MVIEVCSILVVIEVSVNSGPHKCGHPCIQATHSPEMKLLHKSEHFGLSRQGAGLGVHPQKRFITPRVNAQQGVKCAKKFQTFLSLTYSLSEVHYSTGRLLLKLNGLQHCFAARLVFMAFANPVSVSFGGNTHKTTTTQTLPAPIHTSYGSRYTVEHAYSAPTLRP